MSRHLYVETSALLRALLDGDDALRPLLEGEGLYTSALTFVETARAISRLRRESRLSPDRLRAVDRQVAVFERACEIVPMEDDVLARARASFPREPLRTLDAIHIATLQLLDEALGAFEMVSCDGRVRENSEALGFAILPAAS